MFYDVYRMVPPGELLQSLSKYLSLNPNIHLLPPTILLCLASLFTVSTCDHTSYVGDYGVYKHTKSNHAWDTIGGGILFIINYTCRHTWGLYPAY